MVPDLRSPRTLAHPLRKDLVWTLSRLFLVLTKNDPYDLLTLVTLL